MQSLFLTTLVLGISGGSPEGATQYEAADEPQTGWPSETRPHWNCGIAGGQQAINRCYRERAEAAEVQMEAAYDGFARHFIPDGEEVEPPIVEDQQEAQAAFVTYREIHCADLSYSQGGGSATDMVLYSCRAELTELRAQHLINLVELF
ncbi:MAG: lysozyme inhibitor LprI family protein [Pontixanthobacter sp.]